MRLIDADALKELIRSKTESLDDTWDTMGVLNAINQMPTISPKPDTNEVEKTIKKDETEFFNNIGKYLKACREERGEDI